MSMTKKEKEELEYVKIQAAFRRTFYVPPDVLPPDTAMILSTGFIAVGGYGYDGVIAKPACSSFISHAIGRNDITQSQCSLCLWSTEVLALKAKRYELEEDFAKRLRKVDIEIEKAEKEGKTK